VALGGGCAYNARRLNAITVSIAAPALPPIRFALLNLGSRMILPPASEFAAVACGLASE
jgi:hypothetical protein